MAATAAARWSARSLPFQDVVQTGLMSHEEQIVAIHDTIVAIRPQLTRLAYRLLGNRSDAEDVVHNSCVRALENASRLKAQENIRGWLMTTTRHLAIDRCRVRVRYVPFGPGQEPSAVEPEAAPLWTELGEGDVRNALQQCSPTFREVYELHVLQGLSYEETARRLSNLCRDGRYPAVPRPKQAALGPLPGSGGAEVDRRRLKASAKPVDGRRQQSRSIERRLVIRVLS